jgi:DNA-binding response OmpR family regulator
MKAVKILYAEDDETLAFLTKDSLEQQNYTVMHCKNGDECYNAFRKEEFDLCILDIMLPKMDGFELVMSLRSLNPHVPIMFLSAKTLKEDRIKGLRLGADDYLVKPFSMEELILKIEIFLKRSKKNDIAENGFYDLGAIQFNSKDYTFVSGGKKISLTERESELLKFFLDNHGKVLKRELILKSVWGNDDYFLGRSLDVFISRLRKMLAPEKGIIIQNVHGVGFKMVIGR